MALQLRIKLNEGANTLSGWCVTLHLHIVCLLCSSLKEKDTIRPSIFETRLLVKNVLDRFESSCDCVHPTRTRLGTLKGRPLICLHAAIVSDEINCGCSHLLVDGGLLGGASL